MPKEKSGKYVRSIQDLPKWFKLSSYECTQSWAGETWRHELALRQVFATMYQETLHAYESICGKRAEKYQQKIKELTVKAKNKKSELIDLISVAPAISERISEQRQKSNEQLLGDPDAALATMHEIRTAERAMDVRLKREVPFSGTRLVQALSLGDIFSVTSLIDVEPEFTDNWFINFDDLTSKGSRFHFKVDFEATDDAIVEDFKENLRAYRRLLNIPEPKKPTKAVIRKLSENCVLPYIDLKIWADSLGVTIKHSVLCRVLFPNGEKDEYSLRTQVIPLANEAMTEAFQNSI